MVQISNIKRFILVIVSSIVLISCSAPDGYRGSTKPTDKLSVQEVERWSEDLDFLIENLEKRHINLYHSLDKAHVRASVEQIRMQLPSMSYSTLKVALMNLVNRLGDGHTMSGWWGNDYWRFPLSFKWFGNDLRVIATDEKYAHVLGSKLVAINQIPINKIVSTLSQIAPTSSENVYAAKEAVSWTINVSDVLFGLEIIQSYEQSDFTFEDNSGGQYIQTVKSISHLEFKQGLDATLPSPKADFGDAVESTDGISLYVDQFNLTAYIDFDHYPNYWDMFWFGPNVIEQLEDSQIENIIIDLRDNGGGNFFIGLFLAQELIVVDNIDWQNGVYVLVDHGTFSAASSNAVQYRQILNAQVIGEPSGGNPHGYQDSDTFYLPNSGWPISYSKRLFRLQDKKTAGVEPDTVISLTWEDYQKGIDTQLLWVVNKIAAKRKQNQHDEKSKNI
jgi:hypothetical protein